MYLSGSHLIFVLSLTKRINDMKRYTEFFEVIATNTQTGEVSRFVVTERWQITSIQKQNPGCEVRYSKTS